MIATFKPDEAVANSGTDGLEVKDDNGSLSTRATKNHCDLE